MAEDRAWQRLSCSPSPAAPRRSSSPAIERGKEERAAAERRRDAAFEAAKRRRLAEEGRPHSGRGERPPGDLSPAGELRARRALVGDLERAITRDARARVRAGKLDGPVLATECEINPPSQRAVERDLDAPGLGLRVPRR